MSNENDRQTPMMKQYLEAKKACPDTVLLFRMGDFYEMFMDDARLGARVLNLALTSREKGAKAMPMCGFPHHQVDAYVGKLINAGFRAAVCEQVEDPKQAKGLVRREVTRVVTPGTLTEDVLLNPRESNYLAAAVVEETVGIAWVDLSTGRFYASGFPKSRLLDQLARIQPSECLLCEGETLPSWMTEKMMVTTRPSWSAGLDFARKELAGQFHVLNMEGFGFHEENPLDRQALRAAGMVLDYLKETQKASLAHIDALNTFRSGEILEIDESSRRSLEITRTLRDGKRDGSLLAVLDDAVTSMGSRQLADWVANPLTDPVKIRLRQDAVGEFLENSEQCDELRKTLRGIYDLERLLSRVTTGRASPRDLYAIGQTLRMLPELKTKIATCRSEVLQRIANEIDLCPDLCRVLGESLVDDPPLTIQEGGILRPGYNAQLDELRNMAHGGRTWISKYQNEEIERTGIANLKVGYNKVFGFYIEVMHSQNDRIPPDYIRKQTIKNAERYITPKLKEYEEVVLSADEKSKELEYRLFLELRERTNQYRKRMKGTATVLAELDVLLSFAVLARQRNYCRPTITQEAELEILDGRHPVLDRVTPDGEFVPNDVLCDDKRGKILLITGPNMSGKSTYIRQAALLVLMTQIGSFIPAREAKLGVVDRIFTRVGASDELARGQSTFMVEMTETARILNMATAKSLVILDEIGRGTSTYDGISLAWAILEYLHDRINCRTLFATHYHELTDLTQSLERMRNLNVAVREWKDEVVFLHKIIEGATDKSYGIHVARLAGVPREVLDRAHEILAEMENRDESPQTLTISRQKRPGHARIRTEVGDIQLLLFDPKDPPMVEELRKTNVDNLTPLQALTLLEKWKKELK
ncbi:MAG: DNA mismatch repair protein MutS [Planctomycetia bacterium]|nr:DNA mismatch repair protein MutS [Planctomycetia bacterium]